MYDPRTTHHSPIAPELSHLGKSCRTVIAQCRPVARRPAGCFCVGERRCMNLGGLFLHRLTRFENSCCWQLQKPDTAHFKSLNFNRGIRSILRAPKHFLPTMADYDPERGEMEKAKRSDSWVSISTARFRRPSTSPNAAARLQEACEAGMSV